MNKPAVKVAVIGAGSYVFGPSVMYDAIVGQRLEGLELALIDPNRDSVELMAAIGRRMAGETGVGTIVSAHTERQKALDGADFVICSAARDLQRRFSMDVDIIHRIAPDHLVTEFGGVQGISYSLRQIALIEEIVADMRKLSPKAWLLDSANPLPRVCQTAHESGISTAGFCCNSMGGHHFVGQVMMGIEEDYPWSTVQARYEMISAGMNHFTWMINLLERKTGKDVAGEFCGRLRASGLFRDSVTGSLLEETGFWCPNGDDHMRDFIPPTHFTTPLSMTSHGSSTEREQRFNQLRDAAEGRGDWKWLIAHRAWEKPMDFVAALAFGRKCEFYSLNLINRGQIPNLPEGVFVETPATCSADGPLPRTVSLPEPILRQSKNTAEVTETIVRAAKKRSRKLLRRAVELDPTIIDKKSGMDALDECLKAHADILPEYE